MDEVFKILDLTEIFIVADIGCGLGDYTVEFARQIGEKGTVYAVDVDKENIEYTKRKVEEKNLDGRIKFVQAGTDKSNLPQDTIDFAFSRNSYHHIQDPVQYFSTVLNAMKPGASLVLIDHDSTKNHNGPVGHAVHPDDINKNLQKAGFTFKERYNHLPGQSFQVFQKDR